MPELPEVETIKRGLENKILHKNIKEVQVKEEKVVINGEEVKKYVPGNFFSRIIRKGKLLILETSNSTYLVVHLKMTGQLIYVQSKEEIVAGGHPFELKQNNSLWGGDLPNKYTALSISFEDDSKLFFNSIRKFSYTKLLTSNSELEEVLNKLGADAWNSDISFSEFKTIFSKLKSPIKTCLLDQTRISGLGNIYVDEILFSSGIRPDRNIGSVSSQELYNIFKNIKPVLEKAVEHKGTTFSDYKDEEGKAGGYSQFLQVYGREGKECIHCKSKIKKHIIGNRSSHFCPECQK